MNIRAEIFGGRSERKLLQEKRPKESDAKGLADVAISRTESRRSNNRDQDRFRLSEALIKVSYAGADYDAKVVNLSGGDAMISSDLRPNLGEHVHLHFGEAVEGAIECAVRWIKGDRLGLEFAHETQLHCAEDDKAALLREVINRDFPDQKFSDKPQVPEAPEPIESRPGPEQRCAFRHPLIWSGELHYGTHSWRVRLRNISATGALVECPGSLRIDSEVLLDLAKAGAVTATVSWIMGDHVGLAFDQHFDLRQLSEAKPRLTPRGWKRPDYLKGELEAGSAWDNGWERLSIDDLRSHLEGFLKR